MGVRLLRRLDLRSTGRVHRPLLLRKHPSVQPFDTALHPAVSQGTTSPAGRSNEQLRSLTPGVDALRRTGAAVVSAGVRSVGLERRACYQAEAGSAESEA